MNSIEHDIKWYAELTRGKPTSYYPEEFSLLEGYSMGCTNARIHAFGAIRRAVKVARWYDDVAKGTDWLTPEYIEDCKESARAVRWAIRAAIGSDKT